MTANRPESKTPSMQEIIEAMIEDRLMDVYTTMPATVKSIDEKTGLLSVVPAFSRIYAADPKTEIPLPVIEGVPLANLRAGDAIIAMPVEPGHHVTLWFSQRSLENWKEQGRAAAPGDPRIFHISDAIAYPGGYPVSGAIKTKKGALQIKYGASMITMLKDESVDIESSKAKIRMIKDGKFQIGNGSVNLLKIVKDSLTESKATSTAMQAATFPTSLGPSGTAINAADFLAIDQKIDKLLELMQQILLE